MGNLLLVFNNKTLCLCTVVVVVVCCLPGPEESQQLPEVMLSHLPQLQPGPRPHGDGLQRVHQRVLRQDWSAGIIDHRLWGLLIIVIDGAYATVQKTRQN